MFQYRQLQYFIAVATELNFHRAAAKLNITQPPLSQAIKNLEQEIGTPLFVRARRSIALTPAGKALFKRAPSLIASAMQTMKDVQSIGQGIKGEIDISYNSAVMLIAVTDLIKKFREQHPEIAVNLNQMASNLQISAVQNREFDVGFVDIETFNSHKQLESIEHFPAMRFDLVAALPKSHRLSGRDKISFLDIQKDPHIILGRHQFPSLHDRIISACNEAGYSPDIHVYARQMPDVLSLVAAGFGVAIAPDCAIPGWSHSVHFAKLDREEFIDIYAITNQDAENTALYNLISMLPFTTRYS